MIYKDLKTRKKFQSELKKRRLSIDGTSQELVNRLVINDVIGSSLLMREFDLSSPHSFISNACPEEFFCPITMEIMDDPVMTPDGHTYDRLSITKTFESGIMRSPLTNLVYTIPPPLAPIQVLKLL